mmetsp:Transcript_15229/g.33225  ORF Transcript_15229/g.33225 Transcript_15229/m.33225 type:complete len:236 (-) Transcript_15229:1111-1818(-)
MRESGDLVVGQGLVRVAKPLCPALGVVSPLADQTQVSIQRDPHGRIKRYLKRRPHVLSPHRRHELLALHHLYHLANECLPVVDLVAGGSLLVGHFRPLLSNGVPVIEDRLDLGLIHDESLLDARLPRPCVPVRLPFEEDDLGIAGAIPSEAVGDGPRRFVEAAMVQLKLVVVEVNTVRQLAIALPRASLLQEHGQMFQYCILHFGHILRPHPVLGGAPQKALARILVLLGALIVA